MGWDYVGKGGKSERSMADRQKVRSVTKAQESEAPNAIASSQTSCEDSAFWTPSFWATDLPALSARSG
jgi:hypothetical protein